MRPRSSSGGNVYALNAATGAKLWSFTSGAAVRSSPAVAEGVVYAGSDDFNLSAFDLAGGLAAPARPSRRSLHPTHPDHLAASLVDARRDDTARRMAAEDGPVAFLGSTLLPAEETAFDLIEAGDADRVAEPGMCTGAGSDRVSLAVSIPAEPTPCVKALQVTAGAEAARQSLEMEASGEHKQGRHGSRTGPRPPGQAD